MVDTPNGETGTQGDLENKANNQGTPPVVKTEVGEVEKLRKEKEQAEMQANMLRNQLKAKEEAEAERKAKELKDKEEYKTLYENTQARLDEKEAEEAAREKKEALRKASEEVLAEYPEEVKLLVKETGLELSSDDESSKEIFKQKLDKINTTVGKQKVSPNNHGTPPESKFSLENSDGVIEAPVQGSKFDEYVASKPGMASMLGNK